MSIIQNIRDRAAWIIGGAIALALIAFIVQDAFQNQSFLSSDNSTLGKVAGKKIDAAQFDEKMRLTESQYQNAGYQVNESLRQNIREAIWNEYVEDAIMSKRYEKLGIQTSDRELSDMLFGANPPQDLRQQFTDPNTGQYNATLAYQQITALRKQKNDPRAQNFERYLVGIQKGRQREKYLALLANTAYVPKWIIEKNNADNSQKSSISFVNIPYTTVSDSAVKVSDDDINTYVNNHKEEFKQTESRSIEYVSFSASPTQADSLSAYNQVNALKGELATTQDIESFIIRSGSERPYYDGFILKSKMQAGNVDTIQALPEGAIYGPFLDGSEYVIAKMVAKRQMADSVKVRHILIKFADQGRPVLEDSVAKKRIDSIVAAINAGANFDSMVVKFTDDAGSKDKKGEYDFASIQFGNLSREFAEVAFYGKVGDKKTVRVENAQYGGYHYIEVLSQKNFEPAYKVAYITKSIIPSDATDNAANGLASQFAAESRNKKSFEENAKKRNLNRFTIAEITPLQADLQGLGEGREVVRWAYEAEVGDVSDRPFKVGDAYIIPMVTRVYKEGIMTAEKARPSVESIVRNQKKAQQIISKIGTGKSLEAVAQAVGQGVMQSDSIFFSTPFVPNVGQESKVVGASFNKQLQGKVSEPIVGNGGVFVIRVNNISAVSNPGIDITQQRVGMQQMQQRLLSNPPAILEILKKTITIKDNRAKFF